jgi:transposase-like protein
MNCCKKCQGKESVKNGHIRGHQRYKCKTCGFIFIDGDRRVKPETAAKRALAVILYSLGKASYGFIAKLFGVTRATVLQWIRKEGALIEKPKVPSNVKEMEFDEMWHFIGSKKTSSGLSKPWIVLQEELWHGYSVVVALQHLKNSTPKLAT